MLPWQLLMWCLVSNRYFFYILLQPPYGTLFIPPPTDKTSIRYLLQPLDGNAANSHFFFISFFTLLYFGELSKG